MDRFTVDVQAPQDFWVVFKEGTFDKEQNEGWEDISSARYMEQKISRKNGRRRF